MRRGQNRIRPDLEPLHARIVCSVAALAMPPASQTSPILPKVHPGTFPSANRFRTFTPADLQAYAAAYLAFSTDKNYNAAYDFNGSGFIGQNDATPILRGVAGVTPHLRANLQLQLAHGEQLFHAHPSVNGAATRLGTVTLVGQTTPNSVIFYDSFINTRLGASGNYTFTGGALVADSRGQFLFTFPLTPLSKDSITTVNLLVRTPFNEQLIRAFPIFRVGR